MQASGFLIKIHILLILAACISCNATLSEKDINSIQEEKKARTIKSIKPADIQAAAYLIGQRMVTVTDSMFIARLKKASDNMGLDTAIVGYHNLVESLIDSIGMANKVVIKRIAPQYSAGISETESAVLEAYQYNVKNKMVLNDNVQELVDNKFLFTQPLEVKEGICLNCHGDVQRSNPKIHDLLVKSYPKFTLSGYKKGSLIGIWSITIPKKEIVKSL